MARSYVRDEDIPLLIKQCPNLHFLDISGTAISHKIIPYIINGWGHSMTNLALLQRVSQELMLHTMQQSARKKELLSKLVEGIDSMAALLHLRIGKWRYSTAPE